MEVWGGSQLTQQGVAFGGLNAWVYSKPYQGADRGGDVYYASSCATGRISRLLLADVCGHGTAVAETAAELRDLMRRFVNRLDQGEFVRKLNQQFAGMSRKGTFATAVVTTYFAPSRRLTVCNAGHPRPLLYRAAMGAWEFLCAPGGRCAAGPLNVPLGLLAISEYEQFEARLEAGDRVMIYTDALMEAEDGAGEMLGEEGVLELVRRWDGDAMRVLEAIDGLRPGNLDADDVTVMVITATGEEPPVAWGTRIAAGLRLVRDLARGETVSFPEWSVENVGGAIVPALGRRSTAKQ
jgi:serine phosphatase RsbU (regulator of sigma subunit)